MHYNNSVIIYQNYSLTKYFFVFEKLITFSLDILIFISIYYLDAFVRIMLLLYYLLISYRYDYSDEVFKCKQNNDLNLQSFVSSYVDVWEPTVALRVETILKANIFH